jgi:hypothetical protein
LAYSFSQPWPKASGANESGESVTGSLVDKTCLHPRMSSPRASLNLRHRPLPGWKGHQACRWGQPNWHTTCQRTYKTTYAATVKETPRYSTLPGRC